MPKQTITYLGTAGEFISGIPMRDLTMDEWNALPEHLRRLAIAAKLYRTGPSAEAPKEGDA